MTTYIALDLETTGLDPETDEIIEVAAVRFDASGVIATYESLVNPDRALEYRIALLTGIDTRELERAPHFASIASEVESFIGLDPVVGQNPSFDAAFLARRGIPIVGPLYDTFEIAGLVANALTRRGLGDIADHLGVDFPTRHRAMADADAARRVFLVLRERLAAAPPEVLAEAERIAAASDWPLRHLLRDVASEHPRKPGDAERDGFVHQFVKAPSRHADPLVPTTKRTAVPPELAAQLIASQSARTALESYEQRPEQIAMTRAVADTFAEGGALITEAGTGVGKSLAYLVPAALHAVRNNDRVTISTNTINLQEQLIAQDIPVARRILEEAGIAHDELRVAQLKGRRNYLCLLRWSAARRSASLSADEARVLVQLLFWLSETETGDRAELRLRREEDASWAKVSAQDGGCLTMQCPFVRDGSCFLHRARKRAEGAHLLVVNHALLLSDVAAAGAVLPEYRHLVVDEAHHLEAQATEQLGFSASQDDLLDWLDALHTRATRSRDEGLAVSIEEATRVSRQAIGYGPQLRDLARTLATCVAQARGGVPEFFRALQQFGQQHTAERGDNDDRVLINRSVRVQPDWADIEAAWFEQDDRLAEVAGVLDELNALLAQVNPSDVLDRDTLAADASELYERGERLRGGISRIIGQDERQTICWLTMGRRDASPALASAPLDVAEALRATLFAPRETTVLTSATLAADSGFDYIKGRLGFDDARELLLGSPFDYRQSMLMLLPTDMPEPQMHGYAAAVQSTLIDVVRASEGRTLVLFTSHAALRTAYGGIKRALEDEQILVLGQGIDGTPRQLLSVLRENRRVCIMGAASFWEGVDVTGEALSLLVIARLPFPVPSDPIFQARSDLFDQPFEQYAVPQAVLRFKQGFGRLIRRKTDRGALVVLDSRLRTRKYGEAFLRALPPSTLREMPLRDLPAEISGWLAQPDTALTP